MYRPVGTLSYLFNCAVLGNGEHTEGYHRINPLLHLGNVFLVYALARRLLHHFWPPVFVAGLWAVHPVLTESITNIIGRVDLLAGMAVLSGLLFYLQSDPSCEVVHRHLCEGSIGAEQIYTQAGRAIWRPPPRKLRRKS